MENRYILKFNNKIYCYIKFKEIIKILISEVCNESEIANKLILLELLKIESIIKKNDFNLIFLENKLLEKIYDYILTVNDNKLIINTINDLKLAEIIELK